MPRIILVVGLATIAVFAGQHQFEQTFSLPVEAMARPELSPLRTLARISGRELVTGKRQSRAA